MSLLRDIQQAAVDPGTDVATLLRRYKILAVRLGSEEFKLWVDHELNGYKNIKDLPGYRRVVTGSYGQFVDWFGRDAGTVPIPAGCLPSQLRDRITKGYLMEPIRGYESFIDGTERDNPIEPWPADMTAKFAGEIYRDMRCISAWKLIPRNAIVALVDTVKTRVLNFVLEIEGEAPDAGEAPQHQPSLPQEKVSQIFNAYITGPVQNVATGGSHFEQQASYAATAPAEVFHKLLEAMTHAPAGAQAVPDLTATVEAMQKSYGTSHFGKHYTSFMSIHADHMQVFGPLVAPYLPMLARLVAPS